MDIKINTDTYVILDHSWFNVPNFNNRFGGISPTATIGIVTVKTPFAKTKTYIGLGKGQSFMDDVRDIIKGGVTFDGYPVELQRGKK